LNTSNFIAELSHHHPNEIKAMLNSILEDKGIEYRHIYNDLFEKINFNGMSYLKEILDRFWQTKPQLQLYEGAYTTLAKLKDCFVLTMLTDGYVTIQNYKIDNLNIRDFFYYILITDSLGVEYRKPSVKPYEILLTQLNLSPSHCIYVGNDPKRDFIGAKKLGIKTVRILQGDYQNFKVAKTFDADFSINSIVELSDCINNKIWTNI
jgi:putative hydrolase of the HAD superfamily